MTHSPWKLGPGTLVLALVLLAGLTAGWRALQPTPLRDLIRDLRAEVALARNASERCQSELDREEARFRTYEERVRILRSTISDLEGLHPDGVPQPRYDEYLATVEEFNELVLEWDARAEQVRKRWEECRLVIAAHNRLADSLRILAAEAGSELVIEERILPGKEEPTPDTLEVVEPEGNG